MFGRLPLGLERILFIVRLFAEFKESNIFPTQNPILSEKLLQIYNKNSSSAVKVPAFDSFPVPSFKRPGEEYGNKIVKVFQENLFVCC